MAAVQDLSKDECEVHAGSVDAGLRLGEAFGWAVAFLALNYVTGALTAGDGVGAQAAPGFAGLDLLAAAVAVWRLGAGAARAATVGELLLLATLAGVGTLGPHAAAPFALTLLGVWLLARPESASRAAAAIVLALGAHELWSKLLFAALAPELVQLDAVLVGSAVKATVRGAVWTQNMVGAGKGHIIAIADGCSSFANVSSALLVWVAVTKAERLAWTRRDPWVGAAAALAQVALNTARLYLMALSRPLYLYWHDGAGAQIYVGVAAATAVLITVAGARWAERA